MPIKRTIRKSTAINLENERKPLPKYLIEGGDKIFQWNGYTIHMFTTVGNHEFRVTPLARKENGVMHLTELPLAADVLLVAGGGTGGWSYGDQDTGKGGGGAGGVVFRYGAPIAAGTYSLSVGAGGPSRSNGVNAAAPTAPNGQNTTGFSVTAIGGGGGGSSDNNGAAAAGGSGGGGAARNPTGNLNAGAASNQPGFSGWFTYGNAGGPSGTFYGGTSNTGGGGGGGASASGALAEGKNNDSSGGEGGAGVYMANVFSEGVGEHGWVAGGGGGGSYSTSRLLSQAAGGKGGGGAGNTAKEHNTGHLWDSTGIDGAANTGGGGGGSSEDAGIVAGRGSASGGGGPGVIVIRYANNLIS